MFHTRSQAGFPRLNAALLKNVAIAVSAFAVGGVLFTAMTSEGNSDGARAPGHIEVPAEYSFTADPTAFREITGDTFHAYRVEPTGVLTGGYTVADSDTSMDAGAVAGAAVVGEVDASRNHEGDVTVATIVDLSADTQTADAPAASDISSDATFAVALAVDVEAVVDPGDAIDVSLVEESDTTDAILAISGD